MTKINQGGYGAIDTTGPRTADWSATGGGGNNGDDAF